MSRIVRAPDHAGRAMPGTWVVCYGMVRIGELENGDFFVPVPAEHDAEGHVVGGIMCRIAADTDEHAGWMRGVEAGRVELVRRDPTRKFAWVDGSRS
jgi:hypothetical protein